MDYVREWREADGQRQKELEALLVQRSDLGDRDAQEALFAIIDAILSRWRAREASITDDCRQEALLELTKRCAALGYARGLGSGLPLTVFVRNAAQFKEHDAYRSERRLRQRQARFVVTNELKGEPNHLEEARLLLEFTRWLRSSASPTDIRLVGLRYQGMAWKEIAREYGLPDTAANSLSKRLSRLLADFRTHLGQLGAIPTTELSDAESAFAALLETELDAS